MTRRYCFISASLVDGQRRWAWHVEGQNGVGVRSSERDFGTFRECIKHAFAHGYRHVEVPVLKPVVTVTAGAEVVEKVQEKQRQVLPKEDVVLVSPPALPRYNPVAAKPELFGHPTLLPVPCEAPAASPCGRVASPPSCNANGIELRNHSTLAAQGMWHKLASRS